MWYACKFKELDYSRPIAAEHKQDTGLKFLLLPQIRTTQSQKSTGIIGYGIIGYNWFNVGMGRYSSCTCWEDATEAVREYRLNYNIYNVDISLETL